MPIVTIDPGAGVTSKFATHTIATGPGGELAALGMLAKAAGVDLPCKAPADGAGASSAAAACDQIERCRRLGVLVSAEYGRPSSWRQIGYVAGLLATAAGGGVAPQTTGAGALGAVRLAERHLTVSLADALSGDGVVVAVGCDLAGMLGRVEKSVFAAAAPLPNRTTELADVVLPLAMACETGGTILLEARPTRVAPLLPPPAGVHTAAGLIAALAQYAGVAQPDIGPLAPPTDRARALAPAVACGAPEVRGTRIAREPRPPRWRVERRRRMERRCCWVAMPARPAAAR